MAELAPGAAIAGYVVERVLGGGAIGVVYACRDPGLDRRVAVKVLRREIANEEDAARFERERRALAKVHSPHVVSVFSGGECAAGTFFAMELLEGGSLAERLRVGPALSVSEVLGIGLDVARGLRDAAAAGVVHRDVKPANIMLTAGGAVLTDFGLARPITADAQITTAGIIMGTPHYLAPEVIRGEPPTPSSDAYGLGCVLYEMLTGGPPFATARDVEILTAHLEGEVPPLLGRRPDTPIDLAQLIHRMLGKNPRTRLGEPDDVVTQLMMLHAATHDTSLVAAAPSAKATAAWPPAPPAAAALPSMPPPSPLRSFTSTPTPASTASAAWAPADDGPADDDAPHATKPWPLAPSPFAAEAAAPAPAAPAPPAAPTAPAEAGLAPLPKTRAMSPDEVAASSARRFGPEESTELAFSSAVLLEAMPGPVDAGDADDDDVAAAIRSPAQAALARAGGAGDSNGGRDADDAGGAGDANGGRDADDAGGAGDADTSDDDDVAAAIRSPAQAALARAGGAVAATLARAGARLGPAVRAAATRAKPVARSAAGGAAQLARRLRAAPAQTKAVVGAGAVVVGALVVALIAVAARGPDALERVARGDAVAVLAENDAIPLGERTPQDDVVRAHALYALGKRDTAFAAWMNAAEHGAPDPYARAAALGELDHDEVEPALRLLRIWPEPSLDDELRTMARGPLGWRLHWALTLLEDRKALGDVDAEALAIKQLREGASCPERRLGIDRLARLGKSAAAVDAIDAARKARNNACMRADFKPALAAVRAKMEPPAN